MEHCALWRDNARMIHVGWLISVGEVGLNTVVGHVMDAIRLSI